MHVQSCQYITKYLIRRVRPMHHVHLKTDLYVHEDSPGYHEADAGKSFSLHPALNPTLTVNLKPKC